MWCLSCEINNLCMRLELTFEHDHLALFQGKNQKKYCKVLFKITQTHALSAKISSSVSSYLRGKSIHHNKGK